MSHEASPADREGELDAALSALPQLDLDAMSARTLELAALRRLRQDARPSSRAARFEAPALVVLALLQLLWSLSTVFAHAG